METGRKAADLAALNALAVARQHLGSLDKVTRIVRLGVSVATSGDVRDRAINQLASWGGAGSTPAASTIPHDICCPDYVASERRNSLGEVAGAAEPGPCCDLLNGKPRLDEKEIARCRHALLKDVSVGRNAKRLAKSALAVP